MKVDCIIIGAGHNGLVCATYLARGGRSVLVLEAADQVGGAAVTREFAPGFKVSACAHLLYSMPRALMEDLALEHHGLTFAASQITTTALAPGQGALILGPGGLAASCSDANGTEIEQGYLDFTSRLSHLAAALHPVLDSVPPRLGTGSWQDKRKLLQLGWRIRRLGRHDMRELLRIGAMNIHDLLQEHFTAPLLQGALAFDAVLGSNLGPRSPGSVFTLLYRLATTRGAGGNGVPLAQPGGGLGSVSKAIAAAAAGAGAKVLTGTPVRRIVVRDHRAVGVQLLSGEVIEAPVVISNVDPQTTFLRLLGAEYLDAGFTRRVANIRLRGLAAKLHLALDCLPQFDGVAPVGLGNRLLIAPSLDYLERAFNHSKYGEFSASPAMEITLPTVADATLAPPGKHILSAIIQYAPYDLKTGWGAGRRELTEIVIDTLEQYAPGLRKSIVAAELLAPPDIEREFRIKGGHWHHAELALDQFFMTRPIPGAAQYATPVDGLYLCGAGCHPGGGVMGAAGRNAARQVLGEAA